MSIWSCSYLEEPQAIPHCEHIQHLIHSFLRTSGLSWHGERRFFCAVSFFVRFPDIRSRASWTALMGLKTVKVRGDGFRIADSGVPQLAELSGVPFDPRQGDGLGRFLPFGGVLGDERELRAVGFLHREIPEDPFDLRGVLRDDGVALGDLLRSVTADILDSRVRALGAFGVAVFVPQFLEPVFHGLAVRGEGAEDLFLLRFAVFHPLPRLLDGGEVGDVFGVEPVEFRRLEFDEELRRAGRRLRRGVRQRDGRRGNRYGPDRLPVDGEDRQERDSGDSGDCRPVGAGRFYGRRFVRSLRRRGSLSGSLEDLRGRNDELFDVFRVGGIQSTGSVLVFQNPHLHGFIVVHRLYGAHFSGMFVSYDELHELSDLVGLL